MGFFDRLKRLAELGHQGRSPPPLEPLVTIPRTTRAVHDPDLLRSVPREVYGDWLTEQGDVRGLLVGQDDEQIVQALVEAHAQHFYGALENGPRRYLAPLDPFDDSDDLEGYRPPGPDGGPPIQVEWRQGFIERLAIDLSIATAPRLLALALGHPSFALLQTLRVTSHRRTWFLDQLPALKIGPAVPRVHTHEEVLRNWLETAFSKRRSAIRP